jgi:eukaryotic-like serine/threonine-protein kinase
MAAEDWEQIKQVFTAALSVAADRRERFLAEACAGRDDLRGAVTELLSAHYEVSSTFLEPASVRFDAAWLFRTGDRVAGRFSILRAIARGAMGEVYEARDDRLQLRIAIKALRPQLVGDPHTAERFRREVLVTRDIAHEGLCRIFDLIEHPIGPGTTLPEGTVVPCLTMQLLEGQSLEEHLAPRRPMAPAEALPLLHQIADALDVLHDRGIVHRDLKPSNVMLVSSGAEWRAVLTDFGLAKPLDESLFETQSAVHGGAPFFMAPELFRGDRPSRASDIYAFGLLADELVTRERAFSADSLHGLMMQKLQGRPTRPSERAEWLPRVWDEVILQCLDPDPQQRFGRSSDVCRALDPDAARGRAESRRDKLRWPGKGWRYKATAVGISVAGLAGAVIVTGPSPVSEPQSVIVLPFTNLTGDRLNDYLAAGTQGELFRRLNRVEGLRVYAPRDPAAPIDPLREATYALKGHVQQAGARLRITVQLSDRGRDVLLWSQNFEGAREQALELEDALAEEAAAAIGRASVRGRTATVRTLLASVGLPFGNWSAVPKPNTDNAAAFDVYMRGRYLFEERTLPGALAAAENLRRAIDLDPGFAAPYATLADLQGVLMDLHHAPHNELLATAERYANKAVELDPNLPDAQLSLAAVRQMQSRWTEAEQAFRRAIELHPTFARAHRWFGGMLLQFGRFDECLQLIGRALELDPYDYPSQSAYGLALFYAGRPVEAVVHLERVISRRDQMYPRAVLGQVYASLAGVAGPQQDEYRRRALLQSDAIRAMESEAARSLPSGAQAPRTEYADFVGALAWSFRGDLGSAQPFVDRLESGRALRRVSPSILARVYAVQGRTEEALGALEEAAEQGDRELMYLSVSPMYERVRSEPRFRALVQRMQLAR